MVILVISTAQVYQVHVLPFLCHVLNDLTAIALISAVFEYKHVCDGLSHFSILCFTHGPVFIAFYVVTESGGKTLIVHFTIVTFRQALYLDVLK